MTTTEEKYMFQLVTPSKEHYNRLVELKEQYPELTFQNKGYERISKKVEESHKEQILEITNILSKSLKRFSRFQNFIDRDDNTWCIRLQYRWDETGGFTGVGYFDSRHWDPKEHGKH
jgi:hypothetical protein